MAFKKKKKQVDDDIVADAMEEYLEEGPHTATYTEDFTDLPMEEFDGVEAKTVILPSVAEIEEALAQEVAHMTQDTFSEEESEAYLPANTNTLEESESDLPEETIADEIAFEETENGGNDDFGLGGNLDDGNAPSDEENPDAGDNPDGDGPEETNADSVAAVTGGDEPDADEEDEETDIPDSDTASDNPMEFDETERVLVSELTKEEENSQSEPAENPETPSGVLSREEVRLREERRKKDELLAQKRAKRHKRRVRTQILAYLFLLLMIAVLGLGIFALVKNNLGKPSETPDMPEQSETLQEEEKQPEEQIADLLEGEEELAPPDMTPEEVPPTPEERLDEIVDVAISVMSLEDKVAGLFLATPESITGVATALAAGDGTKDALNEKPVGGLVYAGKNVQSQNQFAEMLTNTKGYVSYPTFLAVEEEGGKISPVTGAGIGEKALSAADIIASGDVNKAYEEGAKLGTALSSVGITVDFAPVLNISSAEGGILANRTFGTQPEELYSYAAKFAQGLSDNGVIPCYKYFPGMGMPTSDPAKGRVILDVSTEILRASDFVIFQNAINEGAQMIMMSNLVVPALDAEEVPASLSNVIVSDILRTELKFNGVVVSGNLSDAAITEYFAADEAAIMAFKAGCDMLYAPENYEAAYNGILTAIGQGVISEARVDDALRRIYRIKYADRITE